MKMISKYATLVVILIIIYILQCVRIVNSHSLTMSLIWLLIAAFIWKLPKKKPLAKRKHLGVVNIWSAILAMAYICVLILAGIVDGFGKSPYNHSMLGITYNILFVGSALLGREFIRSFLINNLANKRKDNLILIMLTSLVMTVIAIPFSRFLFLDNLQSTVQFIAQHLAPEFTINILSSYLTLVGGPIASIIYLGILQAFHWLSPILPSLRWITMAVVGVLCPVFSLLTFQNLYGKETKQIKISQEKEEGVFGWMITSVLCIGILWFAIGVFPVYPSVIATGSMQPMIEPGDIILVEKITNLEGIENLRTGDVIQFRRDNILISHRIKEIIRDGNKISFRTKGDNNSAYDQQLVEPEQIRGKIVKVIPKIGWPTLLMKQRTDIPLDEIEF